MNEVKVNGPEIAVKQAALAASSSVSSNSGDAFIAQAANVEPKERKTPVAELPELAAESDQGVENVEQAVTQLNDYVQTVQRNLQFTLDDDSGKTVITVTDKETSEVVRQIPDDVALKLARDLQQDEPISLFSVKV